MLYVVIKKFGGWGEGLFRHDPIFQKGEVVHVVSVDQDGIATVTHEDGEACDYPIPMDCLTAL